MTAKDGSHLSGLLYLASGAGVHSTVLLLHGFPGYEDSRDLAQAMRRAGWNVMVFHYRGLWGSPGTFSVSHAIEDTDAALAYLHNAQNDQRFGIDSHHLVILGHSMGGFLALNAAARHVAELRGVGVMSAVDFGGYIRTVKTPDDLKMAKTLIATTAPVAGSTPDAFVAEVREHEKDWDVLSYVPQLRSLPVLVLEASDPFKPGNAALAAALRSAGDKRVVELTFDTDHEFDDRRIAVEKATLEWLTGL